MNVVNWVVLSVICHICVCHGVQLKEDNCTDAVSGEAVTTANSSRIRMDPTLKYLENKVWDVVAFTDEYGMNDDMATEEDTIFVNAVAALGRKVTRVSIEDEEFDWRSTKVVVVRSAWAKFSYLEEYKAFLDEVNTHSFLFNPRELMRWQSNKINYMRQLADYVKVPHTITIRHTEDDYPSYEELVDILGCTDLIIKPAQGNAGLGVRKINQGNLKLYEFKMEQYLYEKEEDMLVQCFMHSVAHDGPGEINLYVIDGQLTHAGFSTPAKDNHLVHEEYGGWGDDHEPTQQEEDYAIKVYNAAATITGTKPLYFRVDVMYDNDGDLTLMEIACGTTDMNFRDYPESADVMARALDRFLSEKEAEYEQVHGQKPQLINNETFNERLGQEYEWFGTPYQGGTYGKDGTWKRENPSRETYVYEKEIHEEGEKEEGTDASQSKNDEF
jgi:glutathione synthase/RimK-type ligase-like ATP-grasp enzyme